MRIVFECVDTLLIETLLGLQDMAKPSGSRESRFVPESPTTVAARIYVAMASCFASIPFAYVIFVGVSRLA